MMYWNATVTGSYPPDEDIVEVALPQGKNTEHPEIRQLQGTVQFSFTAADPSRHVVLYTLSGKKIADIAAPGKTASLRYGTKGIRMNNGLYAMQIVSEGRRISEKLCVSK